MIRPLGSVADCDALLPTAPLDLSARMRALRARLGLRQCELARRMGLDPSIHSLWEQGKRLVPANRVRSLAEALEVTVEEVLGGVTGASHSVRRAIEGPPTRSTLGEMADSNASRQRSNQPLLCLLPRVEDKTPEPTIEDASEAWVIPERPPLVGWIPEDWEPGDRVEDISPSLLDGYWLDPVRLEKSAARQLLRARLCPPDQQLVGDRDVPGAALAERIYRHCSKEDAFLATGERLPLTEVIFREVLAAKYGGLTDDTLIEALRERSGGVPVTPALLRRLRDSVRPYPIRHVDADLFGGRR